MKDEIVSGNSAGDTSSDKKDSISKKKSSKKKSSSSALERVIRTKSGYSYTKLPAQPKSASSSANDENLIGQTKISGGNALIIPVKR